MAALTKIHRWIQNSRRLKLRLTFKNTTMRAPSDLDK